MPLGSPLQGSDCDERLVGRLTMYALDVATELQRPGSQYKLRAPGSVEDDSVLTT
jgi:hypothetical protein